MEEFIPGKIANIIMIYDENEVRLDTIRDSEVGEIAIFRKILGIPCTENCFTFFKIVV